MTVTDTIDRPYEYAAEEWREVGWSPLPLPPHEKHEPPAGFTGTAGIDADAQQVSSWIQQHPDGNLGLRMPVGVCGIDVDAYKDTGAQSWRELRAECGPLPATWTLTSRTDGESGIRLFRLPADVKLQGAPRPGIEAIQRHHRYAVAWPSIHPDTGNIYRLIGPDGDDNCELPHPDQLPLLPDRWIEAMREHPRASGVAAPRRHVGDWSTAVKGAYADGMAGMTKGSRHDTARDTVAALARLEAQGHPGATDAIDSLGARFTAEIQDRATPQHAEREWRDLLDGARSLVASTPSYRDTWDDLQATGRIDPSGLIANGDPHPDLAVIAGRLAPPLLPEEFWSAREVFGHVRQAAHNRIRSADFVLAVVLARICAYTRHNLELPPIVGSVGSLNFFAAGVGHSGAGKSTSAAVAGELVTRPPFDVADNMPLGSGEGLAELYMGTEEEEDDKGRKIKTRRQVRHNAYVYGDEGAALNAMMERRGATLPEALRRAWSGADLGQANASADRTRVIHAGTYRLGLIVAFQPELAGALLADADAGTPQRFVWFSATDPTIPDEAPPWPGPIVVPQLTPRTLNDHQVRGHGSIRFAVDDAIAHELVTDARAKARGDRIVEPLDSHEPLHRLKLAGLFALLEGRLDISVEDWALSKLVWSTSCRVRSLVQVAVAADRERNETARIDQHARRELAGEIARRSAPMQIQRIAVRLARWLHEQPAQDDGWPLRDLAHRLAGKEKHLLEAALAAALEQGTITELDGRYQPGTVRPA